MSEKPVYSAEQIDRSRDDALEWMEGSADRCGFPRSWDAEAAATARRGYDIYADDLFAPPIAGYEALVAEGLAVREGEVDQGGGQTRIRFRLIEP